MFLTATFHSRATYKLPSALSIYNQTVMLHEDAQTALIPTMDRIYCLLPSHAARDARTLQAPRQIATEDRSESVVQIQDV